jgi:peroxin-6
VGSPVLLRNICPDQSDCAEHVDWIFLHPSRPPQLDALCLPLAQCVTVTPIVSPLAKTRALRSLFLQRLKEYFEVRTRLIKEGDIIAITLDADEGYLAEQIDDKAGGATSYRYVSWLEQ